MTDARLQALEAELVTLVEGYNAKIAEAQRYLTALVEEAQTTINQQRGRILEREFALSEQSDVLTALEGEKQAATPFLRAVGANTHAITDESQKEA